MSCIYSHEDGAYCDKHSHGAATLSCHGEEDCPDRVAQTNADRVRAMTDEDLADFMIGVAQNGGVPTGGEIMRWIDWLKQEVEE